MKTKVNKKVIILGGGIAGMSAAHELVERGFDVAVYEMKTIAGGKARSIGVEGSATNGKKLLPGEHGFRFFPGFYKHVTDTMERIPYPGNAKGVFDNLVATSRIEIARFTNKDILMVSKFPTSRKDLKVLITSVSGGNFNLTKEEVDFFADKMWQLLTSCKERRQDEYEKLGWWEYLEADRFSVNYQKLLVEGLTRTLVAAKAQLANTKTGGDILLQLIFDMFKVGKASDRVLNGPTNEVWIDPWLNHLRKAGVDYHLNAKVQSIACDKEKVISTTILENGKTVEVSADYYIAALPVEVITPLINPSMLAIDPTLQRLQQLQTQVAWMNGMQFFLKQDVPIINGHCIYIDSPWSLTSISQKQFWNNINLSDYGDGTVKGILSVDISDWETPGILYNKPAKECSTNEVMQEVWTQIKKSQNHDGKELLTDDMIHSWFTDPDIVDPNPHTSINLEPLLVNLADSWHTRPTSHTRISNFFLASDYIQTNTDLATMEGANEAARRAVNCIIAVSKVKASYCKIWDLHEPNIFSLWRRRDANYYKRGLPWNGDLPWIILILQRARLWFFFKLGI